MSASGTPASRRGGLLAKRGAELSAARGMTERLNAGRRRMREEWERRQALNAATQPAA